MEPTPVAAKAKPSSEFANLDAFLGSPSTTHRASNSSSPAQQLHGADFFASNEDVVRHSSSAPVTPAHSRPDTPSSGDTGASKHKDLKSSILSLYNTPRSGANASTGTFSPQPAAASSYASNLGNYQQQLSGLSMGPPSGMIPQPPAQQANLYQNVWGGIQEGSSQQAWSKDFTGFNQAPTPAGGFQQTGGHMPQGGQFFMDQTNRPPSSTNTPKAPQNGSFE